MQEARDLLEDYQATDCQAWMVSGEGANCSSEDKIVVTTITFCVVAYLAYKGFSGLSWSQKRALRDNWWLILILIAVAGILAECAQYGSFGVPLSD